LWTLSGICKSAIDNRINCMDTSNFFCLVWTYSHVIFSNWYFSIVSLLHCSVNCSWMAFLTEDTFTLSTYIPSSIIIHISTRNVSFSIRIGQNSVAEWLIVSSINHKNSNQKQPTNLSLQVALWQQSVIYMKCVWLYLLSHPRLRFMIFLILGEQLWINTFIVMSFYSSMSRICNGVNWQLGSEIGPIYGCFIPRTYCDQSKT